MKISRRLLGDQRVFAILSLREACRIASAAQTIESVVRDSWSRRSGFRCSAMIEPQRLPSRRQMAARFAPACSPPCSFEISDHGRVENYSASIADARRKTIEIDDGIAEDDPSRRFGTDSSRPIENHDDAERLSQSTKRAANVPYELSHTANLRDPSDRSDRMLHKSAKLTSLTLTGTLSREAVEAILAAIAKASCEGSDSTLIEFADVDVEDRAALDGLSSELMSLRDRGVEVQISARSDAMYERLSAEPQSRDWLLSQATHDPALPRKSLHMDGRNP